MGMTEAQVVANELERVDPKVPTLFDWDDVFYATIEKRPVEVISSRDMRVPLELRPGGNFGYYDPDGGDLGRGDGPTYEKAVLSSVHMKEGFEWTAKSEWSTDDKRKAVLNTFQRLLAKGMAEFRRQCDSQCMTAGTGVLANPSTVSVGTGTSGGDVWTIPATDGYGVRLLRFGQTVGIYDSTLATKRGETKINFYDLANRVVHTFPSIATAANTDKIVASGLTANPVGLFGVPYHYSNASTGTWLGFDRSATPEIRGNRVNAAGALALPFPRLALNKIGDRVGINQKIKCFAWMHPCQKQAYEELGQLVSVINNANQSGKPLDLYFDGNFQMAGAPVRESYSWDKTRIDFIAPEIWGRAELHPPGFYTVGGQKLFPIRGASGGVAAATIFYIVASFNLYINNPAEASYIDALAIPSGY
jgi:hypothetical protein